MRADRLTALFEILLCSDFPTQLAIGRALTAFGIFPKTAQGDLSITYVVVLSLADAAVLIGLILLLLAAHGDRPREVLLGTRPIAREFAAGLPMTLAVFALAIVVLGGVQLIAPWLHNVPQNPMQDLLRRPRDAGLFALVVVVAGGVREEIQRAFIIHRFDRWLGGAGVGIVVSSAMFGVGHLLQGYDVAITTALMGAFWAVVYVRRRSVIAPLVSHSGFDLIELTQYFLVSRSVRL